MRRRLAVAVHVNRVEEGVQVQRLVAGAAADRLRELGLTRGTSVELLRQAPFGGPMIFSLRGYQLCLRPTEAAKVLVGLSTSPQ